MEQLAYIIGFALALLVLYIIDKQFAKSKKVYKVLTFASVGCMFVCFIAYLLVVALQLIK